MTRYHCEFAYLGGDRAVADVAVRVEGPVITEVAAGAAREAGDVGLRGLTLPGFANAHSHAFHRVLRGRAERPGTFWSWRDEMYAVAAVLDPDRYRRLARAVFAEMVLAGFSAVGEFHYLHHGARGERYAERNAMALALRDAAGEAGIRLTLLDACYLERAPGEPPEGVQERFADGDVASWAARTDSLAAAASSEAVRVGAAVHSLRAVPPAATGEVAAWAAARGAPFHVHVSEQRAENDAVSAAYGASPVALLEAVGALGPSTTAVHATHLHPAGAGSLGASRTTVCMCPTTERALGDGIGPAAALASQGCAIALGTDSQSVIDPFEEARALELDERLDSGRRGRFSTTVLLEAATSAGHRAIGWPEAGRIADGALADLVTVSLSSVRLAGADAATLLEHAVFAAGAPDVTDVVVSGRPVVAGGRHQLVGDVAAELAEAIGDVAARRPRADRQGLAVGSVIFRHVGELVTNDPDAGEGPLGVVRDAALLVGTGRVLWAGPAATAPEGSGDSAVDVAGRAVVPGFVDSHTHMVFAGERAAEFAARMAGTPYAAGGIATTVGATRAATDEELASTLGRLAAEAARSGTTTFECKSGYGLDVEHEARLLEVARTATEETTFLGAHVVPAEFAGRADEYVALVTGPMLDACAPFARWVDVFCERGAFDEDQASTVLAAGAARGLGARVHANQLGPGPGVRVAVAARAASADHCTYLDDEDVELLAASATVATLLPACDFSTRAPYPDARRLLDAGAIVALATDCNPGSSYTTSMPLCVALAVRELRMTIEEALLAATLGGAKALRREDVGHLRPGARADVAVLDAPSYVHLAYRPGVPLVAGTWKDGEPVRDARSGGGGIRERNDA